MDKIVEGWERKGFFGKGRKPKSNVKDRLSESLEKLERTFTNLYKGGIGEESKNLYSLVLTGFDVFKGQVEKQKDINDLNETLKTIKNEINAFRSALVRNS